jgi:tol-pal system protein YbgF
MGCATTTGTTQLQADLDTLQQQVWKLQKENAARAQQVAQAAPPAASAPPEQPTAEFRARLESLAHEVQVLQTRAEESEQRINSLTNDLRAARAALETMGRAQAALPVLPVPGAAAPPMGTAARAGNGQEPPPGPPPPMAPASGSGADLFRAGYSDFGRQNYDQALSELEEFLRLHPDDDLADDAQYLIGEVQFSQQKYPEAIGAYDRLLKEHADSDRAASAHLKKGLALLEMNRTADAVIQFQHVVSAYPKSEEARIARERLRALGLRER